LLGRHQLQAVAFEFAFLHFGFGQRVGGDHFEVFGHVRYGFQLQAFDFHFAGLVGDRHTTGLEAADCGEVLDMALVGSRWDEPGQSGR